MSSNSIHCCSPPRKCVLLLLIIACCCHLPWKLHYQLLLPPPDLPLRTNEQNDRQQSLLLLHDGTPALPTEEEIEYYQIQREGAALSQMNNKDQKQQAPWFGEQRIRFEYSGCCGLGHRLARMSSAYHFAQLFQIPHLYSQWGSECSSNNNNNNSNTSNTDNSDEDIFAQLFGDLPMAVEPPLWSPRATQHLRQHFITPSLIANITTIHRNHTPSLDNVRHLEMHNEVQGYGSYQLSSALQYDFYGKHFSDAQFYNQLRAIFRYNSQARQFLRQYQLEPLLLPQSKSSLSSSSSSLQSKKLLIGLHIRAGNGETGDFQDKKRGIQGISTDQWIINAVNVIMELIHDIQRKQQHHSHFDHTLPFSSIIYIATDTPSLIPSLQEIFMMKYNIQVIYWNQIQLKEGEGVTFSTNFGTSTEGKQRCKQSWIDQFMDSTLLAACDVVIAAQYSSFTQTIPLSTVFYDYHPNTSQQQPQRQQQQQQTNSITNKYKRKFCEMGNHGDVMACFHDFTSWVSTPWIKNKSANYHKRQQQQIQQKQQQQISMNTTVEFYGNMSSNMGIHDKTITMMSKNKFDKAMLAYFTQGNNCGLPPL